MRYVVSGISDEMRDGEGEDQIRQGKTAAQNGRHGTAGRDRKGAWIYKGDAAANSGAAQGRISWAISSSI